MARVVVAEDAARFFRGVARREIARVGFAVAHRHLIPPAAEQLPCLDEIASGIELGAGLRLPVREGIHAVDREPFVFVDPVQAVGVPFLVRARRGVEVVLAVPVDRDGVDRSGRGFEVALRIERAGDPGPLVQHLAAVRLPHQPRVVLELVVVVGGAGGAVAVEHPDAPFDLVPRGRAPERHPGIAAAEEHVADQRTVNELLVARRGQLLRAVRGLELSDVRAEEPAPLGKVDVERGIFQERAGVTPGDGRPVHLQLVGQPGANHPAFELELGAADTERTAGISLFRGARELRVVVRKLLGKPDLHAVRDFEVGVLHRDAGLAVAPDDRLRSDRLGNRFGDAVLEEIQLQCARAVGHDGLALRSDAGFGDAAVRWCQSFEPVGIGGVVEDVDAAVLRDFLVIQPLGGHSDGGEEKPRDGGAAAAEQLKTEDSCCRNPSSRGMCPRPNGEQRTRHVLPRCSSAVTAALNV